MEKRFFKELNEHVSLLGFGLMRLPRIDNKSQNIDYKLALSMIDKAIEMGVNYFDTAWMYHDGLSEEFAGEALSGYPRGNYLLASKMPTGTLVKNEKDVDYIFNEQLKRCRVEYFDFYLLHRLTAHNFEHSKNLGIYEYLARKKKEGYIRHLGFSFHDKPNVLEEIVSEYDWDFGQIQLNYIDWDACDAKHQYEILTNHQLPVIVMEPVRGGALATLNQEAVTILRTANPDVSAASWAIRFAASLPNVMTVLSGMSTLEQVEDNLKTMTNFKPISDYERKVISQASVLYNASGTIPCTGCRYCMNCPSGVDIPRVFNIYNHYCTTKDRITFANFYITLQENQRAHNCIACGACVKQCPQGINIPEKMKEIASFSATFERL
ncbi:Fe-S oxidoreductase [Spirochaetia bacterium]|nr:Fe-S oxidoreductase [Spirochaetia bacterium]